MLNLIIKISLSLTTHTHGLSFHTYTPHDVNLLDIEKECMHKICHSSLLISSNVIIWIEYNGVTKHIYRMDPNLTMYNCILCHFIKSTCYRSRLKYHGEWKIPNIITQNMFTRSEHRTTMLQSFAMCVIKQHSLRNMNWPATNMDHLLLRIPNTIHQSFGY